MNRTKLSLLLGVCLASPMLIASPASAQEASAPSARGVQSDEVVVTAERRSTSVREVGFSIQAVSGEALQTAEIHSPTAVTRMVPGITLNDSDHSLVVAAIRGSVSTFRTATLDAPIGFFVDDVYYPYSSDLNTNWFDLNHAEILRGPQGTLFGRNVTGGAIVTLTNNPTFDEDYRLSLSAGNAGYIRTEGMVNGSIIDGVLAGRLAFTSERIDGLIDTPNRTGNGGSSDGAAIRGKLLWTPAEHLRLTFSADYSDRNGEGGANGLAAFRMDGATPIIPGTFNNASGSFSTSHWSDSSSVDQPNSNIQRGANLHAEADLGGGTLTSITSYRLSS
ncbi:MAG: TonB-dependent receptor plug domain-containing protein, partial [Hyphomonadaceae bacterium]